MQESFDFKISQFSLSPVVILQPLNIILAEVGSPLYFDENQLLGANIFDAVGGACGYVDYPAGRDRQFLSIQRHFGNPRNHHPMLGAVFVFLIAESFLRQDFDPFDFVVVSFIQDREATPRTFFVDHATESYTWGRNCATIVLDWLMHR
jgi:hypothetical protein